MDLQDHANYVKMLGIPYADEEGVCESTTYIDALLNLHNNLYGNDIFLSATHMLRGSRFDQRGGVMVMYEELSSVPCFVCQCEPN